MKISDKISDFDNFLSVERNLAERTRKEYRQELRKFVEYLIRTKGSEPLITKIETPLIRQYLNHLQMEREYRASSIARTIVSLRTFFKFCVQENHIKVNPLGIISNPKLPKKLPIYLITSELQKLLNTPDQKELSGIRDAAIITLLAFTGIRLKELVNANLTDIDFERSTLKVFGKGSKERIIPIGSELKCAIADYLPRRELFLNRKNKRRSLCRCHAASAQTPLRLRRCSLLRIQRQCRRLCKTLKIPLLPLLRRFP